MGLEDQYHEYAQVEERSNAVVWPYFTPQNSPESLQIALMQAERFYSELQDMITIYSNSHLNSSSLEISPSPLSYLTMALSRLEDVIQSLKQQIN